MRAVCVAWVGAEDTTTKHSAQRCPCLWVPGRLCGDRSQRFTDCNQKKHSKRASTLGTTNRVLLSPALHCLKLSSYSSSIGLHSSYNQLRRFLKSIFYLHICLLIFSCPSLTKGLKLSCISILWVSLPVSYNPSWNTKKICKFWQGIRIRQETIVSHTEST